MNINEPVRSVSDVEARLARIDAAGRDWEVAHGEEDELLWGVISAIAEGLAHDPQAVCRAVLSRDISNDVRWYA